MHLQTTHSFFKGDNTDEEKSNLDQLDMTQDLQKKNGILMMATEVDDNATKKRRRALVTKLKGLKDMQNDKNQAMYEHHQMSDEEKRFKYHPMTTREMN